MRLKRSELLDFSIWVLVAFYALVGHWIWFGRGIQETIMIALMLAAIVSRSSRKIKMSEIPTLLVLLIWICIIGVSTVFSKNMGYLRSNMSAMAGGLLAFVYLCQFFTQQKERCTKYMSTALKLLTYYMVINSLIILIQNRVPYFLMNRDALASVNNTYYHDQLTGFIGINGTTRWNILSCAVILINISQAIQKKNRRQMIFVSVFTIVSVYIALLNGARAFLVVLPVSLLVYFFVIRKVKLQTKFKYLLLLIALCFGLVLLYFADDYLFTEISALIDDKVLLYLSGDIQQMIASNDDRARAVNYALLHGGLLGKGIGFAPMHFSTGDVKYMGLNSTSSYIYLTGVLGYGVLTWLFAALSSKMIRAGWIVWSVFVMVFLAFSYLLPLYSSIVLMFGVGMIVLIFSLDVVADNKK